MGTYRRRRTYDQAFKLEAVRLVLEEGRKASEVERQLGIGKNIVARWVRQFTDDPQQSFLGKGQIKPADQELRELRRELHRVKQERDILKKAVAIFSEDPDRYSDS
jgi:transposase